MHSRDKRNNSNVLNIYKIRSYLRSRKRYNYHVSRNSIRKSQNNINDIIWFMKIEQIELKATKYNEMALDFTKTQSTRMFWLQC